MLKRTTKPLRRRVLIEESLARSSNKQHSGNTDKWYFCKAGSFSYSESLWTPPFEGLHSTGETMMWRDPGGSWACLPIIYDYEWNHTAPCCHICRTCPQKQSAEHAPKSSWEKRSVLQNAEKKLVLGFLHSVNHTGSPQDESYIHNYFIGWFSQADLLEWMCFVIFHARSCERSQHTSGPISE